MPSHHVPDDDYSARMRLDSAHGYFALGMRDEAWVELEAVTAEYGDSIEVRELTLCFLLSERRWNEALAVSRTICETMPEADTGFIHAAYCLHEMGETSTACETLREGPQTLTSNPLYHYNLGCYHAVLGDLSEAAHALTEAFKLDAKLAEMAKNDPDLVDIREFLDALD
ncbi:MAG: tetratricopeptide repeat protein [Verrucomicrobiae bacterium]|nr:tetratricopeptide repeat protein [Verrucomicrobiae bacterium]